MIRRFVFATFLVIFVNLLPAQVLRSFTPDSVVFIGELTTFFESIGIKENKEQALTTLQSFKELWIAESFNHQQKLEIYATANLMLKNRIKSFPHFEIYLKTLTAFVTLNHDQNSFNTWLLAMPDILSKKLGTKLFITNLEFTAGLLDKNQLYDSRIFNWNSSNGNFRFINDSVLFVSMPQLDLICRTKNDSSIIYQTSGMYYPAEFLWKGDGGRIDWRRAGLNPDSTFATLGNYEILLNSSKFEAYRVKFYNKDYFPESLIGKLEEKISTNAVTADNALYPQFISDVKDLYISEIFRDIDYEGGFSMKGARMIGEGTDENDAIVTFKKKSDDKGGYYELLVARSKTFVFERDRINSARASVSIYHNNDSIYHSGLAFKYINKSREFSMLRLDEGIGQSPYLDSYHGLGINCEAIYWKIDEPNIAFRSTKGIQNVSTAIFTSDKYYSERHFDYLQGIDVKHPLLLIKEFSKARNTNYFYVSEMAEYIKLPENQVEALVIYLSKQGFLNFDIDTKRATILQKVYHYIDAKNSKVDYDVINFVSSVENNDNATLSLSNFDLIIRGVPEVSLSDSQQVYIYPSNEEVVLRKNRDFLFSGKIKAGLFEFYAKDCFFEYDTFRLNLPTIETMRFKVKSFEKNKNGQHELVDVKTTISDLSGDLLIDSPNNKNGLKYYAKYPVFNSKNPSFVYYDKDSSFAKAYDRKSFYYALEPFSIESMESFSTDNLIFKGYLASGGIFPDMPIPLAVQPDYSLGFTTSTTVEGFPVYGGKGIFTSQIFLSLEGLKGKGTLKYQNSITKTNDIIFFLDSSFAKVDDFEIKKKVTGNVQFPSVTGQKLLQRWMPYNDSMLISTTDSSFKMYDNISTLKGTLALTPSQLTGRGTMKFFDADLDARRFVFSDHSFFSDTSNFRLYSPDRSNVTLSASIHKSFIDFNTKTGKFETNGVASKIDFPINRFICFMDEFEWFIEKGELELKNFPENGIPDFDKLTLKEIIDVHLSGSEFISTHPLQDSLMFFSVKANYNLKTNILRAEDVKIIRVADAAIFPADGLIQIEKNALIQPLANATIIADTAKKYHLITDAKVAIESRYSYKASGSSVYADTLGNSQMIYLENIAVDSAYRTFATGKITQEQNFKLSPGFAFKGNITLTSTNPLLNFDGAFMISQDCKPDYSRWVKFDQLIDPNRVILPVAKEPEEFAAKKLFAGFFHSNENNKIYPAFLSRKEYYSDTLMLSVEGELKSRKNGEELLITASGDMGISDKEDPKTRFMKMNTSTCEVSASGPIRFGADFGQVSLNAFGKINHFIIPDSTNFDVVLTLDFFFVEDALKNMHAELDLANAKGVDMSLPKISTSFIEILGKEEADKVLSDMSLYGSIRKIPEAMKKSFMFTDVKLAYNKETRSYVSSGKIGIGSILGLPLNKYYDGYIEIVRKRSGDVLNIYIEIDRRNWYFFNYSSNVMQVISSQTEFNKFIREVKTEKRKDEAEKNETAYRYIISTTQKKNSFLRSMRSAENDDENNEEQE